MGKNRFFPLSLSTALKLDLVSFRTIYPYEIRRNFDFAHKLCRSFDIRRTRTRSGSTLHVFNKCFVDVFLNDRCFPVTTNYSSADENVRERKSKFAFFFKHEVFGICQKRTKSVLH